MLARRGGCVIVGESASADDTVELVRRAGPTVLVVNHRPPGVDGGDVARRLRFVSAGTRVLVIVGRLSDAGKADLLQHGVAALVSRTASANDLDACLARVLAGHHPLDAAAPIPAAVPRPASAPALSSAERDIVALVAIGASNREIAMRLDLDENSVKNRLRRVFRKLRVANRVSLAMLAIEEGLSRDGAA